MGMSRAARMMMMGGRDKHHEDYEHEDKHEREHKKHDERHEEYVAPYKDMRLDRSIAERWVAEMESRDGTKGGKWTYDQTTQLMKQKGFDCDEVDFYVAMNSVWSDYGKTLSKYGVTAPEAYAELAYDWVKDPDAYKDKAARYYEYIVK